MPFSSQKRSLLRIDGSHGEGGGQILRTSLALATLLGQPVFIDKVRKNRSRPGLRPQHALAVHALAQISGAEVVGGELGSCELFFAPHRIKGGHYHFDIGTAGSTSLLLQAVLPPLLFANASSRLTITGGTHVPFSPTYHYIEKVFLPALICMGADIRTSLRRWGWYPHGGGVLEAEIAPCEGLQAIDRRTRGSLNHLGVIAGISGLPLHIAQREMATAEQILAEHGKVPERDIRDVGAAGPGNMVFVWGDFDHAAAGFSALGRRGKPAETVAAEACSHWQDFCSTAAAVDLYLADQLAVYMALASGRSEIIVEEKTDHLLTNIAIIEQFLPARFNLPEKKYLVSVEGVFFSKN